ncbi:tail assembly protein [Acinetobacter sp. P8-3-8]|uniref:tail assembly protein n=1 Tax=Acinetobacter sp. P8-3-8 TaxID=1029823 RepID=UPI0002485580|nr:tail assembly protein [Acinetobacter sp. P8-3-8]
MLKTIKLYGVLAKKFGKQFKLDVANTREAVRALSVQIPGFEKFMLHAHEHGLTFAVFQDKHNISEKELDMGTEATVIKIVPKVIGAGGDNGVLNTILGAVMVVVGVEVGYVAGWTGIGAQVGVSLIGAGIGMMVGGVAQMLMPKIDNSQDQNQDGNKANFGFGGAVTTVAQGNPVPVLRGRREIGGFIVSAGQYAEDIM